MLFPNQVNLFQVTLFYPLPEHTHTERERETDRQTDRQTEREREIGNNGKAEIIDVIFS